MPIDRNFACTTCGKCCNRSPEVELTETLDLSGDFVFWLCFSASELPLSIKDWTKHYGRRGPSQRDLAIFNARRRLLEQQSPLQFTGRSDIRDEAERVRKYIRISALTLDLEFGRCEKLINRECSLYERRPHTCKTVPLHYQLLDLELEQSLDKFVEMEGFECDTSENAEAVLKDGQIASAGFSIDRGAAQATVNKDEPWRREIARRIQHESDQNDALPSFDTIKTSSFWKVILVPIHVAWQIGLEMGFIDGALYEKSLNKQAALIESLIRREVDGCSFGIDVKSRRQLKDLLSSYTGKFEGYKAASLQGDDYQQNRNNCA